MDKSVIHSDYSAFFDNITSALLLAIVVRESDNKDLTAREEAEMIESIILKLGRAHSQLSRVRDEIKDAKTMEEKLNKIFLEFVKAVANMSPYRFKVATKKLATLVKEAAPTRMSLR